MKPSESVSLKSMTKGWCWQLSWVMVTFLLNCFVYDVVSVDKSNFKTCEQSGFCKRLRRLEVESNNPFSIDASTLSVNKDGVAATVINSDTQSRFYVELTAIGGGVIRFKMREAYPVRERFEVPEVLLPDLESSGLQLKQQTDDVLEMGTTDGRHSVKMHLKVFKLELFTDGKHVMTANGRGKLQFEETKPQGDDGEDYSETFKGHTDSVPNGHTGVGMDFTFEGTKHVFGLPEHTDGFALKDTLSGDADPYRLYNLDVFEYELNERMALYASVPFLMSHSKAGSTGLLWLNAAETWVDVSHGKSGILGAISGMMSRSENPYVDTAWISESGIIDSFFLLGPKPEAVSRQLASLTGTTPLPPFFALGYHQCRWNYRDQKDVAEVNANFDNHDIPNDVIWLDIEHTDGKRYFTWDQQKFPTPEEMINGLAAVGRKMVTIVDPHVKVDTGYHVYAECKDQDLFVKTKSAEEFNGWCWPGNSAYSDFLNPKARDYYADQYGLDNYKGSTSDLYIWNDMNEPSVFNGPEVTMQKDNVHFGNVEHRDMHNIYGHLYTMATHEGLMRRDNRKLRPFVLTRSAFAGTQRYAALWTGDNAASWDHLAASIPMCLSLSVAGITFVGADVGGFFGNPEPDLLIRWYQAAAFQPFFRAHAHLDTKRREPWLFDADSVALIREAIRTRYNYLPLWYTLFYELEKDGEPPMRPIFFEFPDLDETFDTENEHMVGNALLVSPVTKPGVSTWDVYLPPTALWYNLQTGLPEVSGTIAVNMHTIPVYQKGGTIVPSLGRVRRSSAVMLRDPYTLTVALDGKKSASGTLYIDDGKTFEYREGSFNYIRMKYENNVLSAVNDNSFDTPAWLELVKIYGFADGKPKAVLLDGRDLGFKYSEENKILMIRKPGLKLSRGTWSISVVF